MTDDPLGEVLLRQRLLTDAQLKTAIEFQKQLGGDLRSIVVKLGYVKETDLVNLLAAEENVGASHDINEDVVDFDALRAYPRLRPLLEKYQVVPIRAEGPALVFAMADPNNLGAIEELQFVVTPRAVEPAVASKGAIRKALNQLEDLGRRWEAKKAPRSAIPGDRLKALQSLPLEKLLRAYLIAQIEAGKLNVDDLLARAGKL